MKLVAYLGSLLFPGGWLEEGGGEEGVQFVSEEAPAPGTERHATHRAAVGHGAAAAAESVAVAALERWRRDGLQADWTLEQRDYRLETRCETLETQRGGSAPGTLGEEEKSVRE